MSNQPSTWQQDLQRGLASDNLDVQLGLLMMAYVKSSDVGQSKTFIDELMPHLRPDEAERLMKRINYDKLADDTHERRITLLNRRLDEANETIMRLAAALGKAEDRIAELEG